MTPLPFPFGHWFSDRGWAIHPNQQIMLDRVDDPVLFLITLTGGGKTMTGQSLMALGSGTQ